jgi:MFS transporter, CP family, cyanate transporter
MLLVIDAGLLGFSTALVFVLTLTLPPILSEHGDTHRFTAGIFTIVYLCPFMGALLGGLLWDMTSESATSFVPLIIGGTLMLFAPLRLRIRHLAAV